MPYQAKLFADFLPAEELLPTAQAIARVFGRLGEKRNRARARIKFLIAKLGLEEFKRLVAEERAILPHDPRWSELVAEAADYAESSPDTAVPPNGTPLPDGFGEWLNTNVYRQKQSGYCVVTIKLPLGDLTSDQMRGLAQLARRFAGENVRTTVEQNMVLRWVSESDLPELHRSLSAIGLGEAGAGTIVDVTACPGTDTCKLGISSSRGLAEVLRTRLAEKSMQLDEAVGNLRVKVSGCFNSCGQHHAADIGFYGVSRSINGYHVPHFQVLLGGMWRENAGSYGLAIGAVPSKRIPEALERILEKYVRERDTQESFQDFVARVGKKSLKDLLSELSSIPDHGEDAWYYSDWGDPREFTIDDMGTGECAGEVISRVEVEFAAADRLVFEAQLHLDEGSFAQSDRLAFESMLHGARTLVKNEYYDVPSDADTIVREFRSRFYDTQRFFDKYAGGKFAQYLFHRYEEPEPPTEETVRRLVAEAQLFVDGARSCYARTLAEQAAGGTLSSALFERTPAQGKA